MTTTAIKTATVKVSYTGHDYDDTYTMKSPSGKTLTIKPNGHWSHGNSPIAARLHAAEEIVLKKIRRLYDGPQAPSWGMGIEAIFSYDEMRLFKTAARKCAHHC